MPIKIIDIGIDSSNGISLEQLDHMRMAFQKHPEGGVSPSTGRPRETTNYALFPIKNIIDLLTANKIALPTDTLDKASTITDYAIKVYFAQHFSDDDCPQSQDFVGRNTVVLVNTKWTGASWQDMLSSQGEQSNYVETTGFSTDGTVDPNEGSDKTYLCPPQCV